jgi:hypothetical protein
MKALKNIVTVIKDGKATITADVVEQEFRFPCQQVTVGYLNPSNIRWPRHIQLSGEAVFVKAYGIGFAIPNEEFVKLASAIEPRTSYSPLFGKMPSPDSLTVDFNSELNPDLQWQQSADDKEWTNIEDATSVTLDRAKVAKGTFVRCVASSAAGATGTPSIKL